MRRMIAKLAMAGALGGLGVAGSIAAAPAAHAAYSVDMNVACQVNYGSVGWRATLAYPGQGGYGWRCYLVGGGGGLYSVNIEQYCQVIYGLHARGGSTAYNWRCDY